jgi:hypothetical protein
MTLYSVTMIATQGYWGIYPKWRGDVYFGWHHFLISGKMQNSLISALILLIPSLLATLLSVDLLHIWIGSTGCPSQIL